MAPVGPWAQPKATRREGGRRAERPAGSYATPDTPCSRTAPEGSLPTERGQTVPALRPELDDPNKFGASNRSAPADRSPRRIAGRTARVAVPRAFFGTFFRAERKYYPLRGGSPSIRAVVGASIPVRDNGYASAGAPKGFPRGKQSARFALPCAPLVVCLNSGSLTAFGGCIHWIPASLRSPLETFGHRS